MCGIWKQFWEHALSQIPEAEVREVDIPAPSQIFDLPIQRTMPSIHSQYFTCDAAAPFSESSNLSSDSRSPEATPHEISAASSKNETFVEFPTSDEMSRRWYRGEVQRGKPNGFGELKWRGGNYTHFVGTFKGGEMKEGTLLFGPEGKSKYSGSLQDNRAEGYGSLEPDALDDCLLAKYEGGWTSGLKDGSGTALFRNNDMYKGTWVGNKMSGYGTYLWSNGVSFKGQFLHDEVHGQGALGFPSAQDCRSRATGLCKICSLRHGVCSPCVALCCCCSVFTSEPDDTLRQHAVQAWDDATQMATSGVLPYSTAKAAQSNRIVHVATTFQHSFPTLLRAAARMLCSLLILLSALHMLPHIGELLLTAVVPMQDASEFITQMQPLIVVPPGAFVPFNASAYISLPWLNGTALRLSAAAREASWMLQQNLFTPVPGMRDWIHPQKQLSVPIMATYAAELHSIPAIHVPPLAAAEAAAVSEATLHRTPWQSGTASNHELKRLAAVTNSRAYATQLEQWLRAAGISQLSQVPVSELRRLPWSRTTQVSDLPCPPGCDIHLWQDKDGVLPTSTTVRNQTSPWFADGRFACRCKSWTPLGLSKAKLEVMAVSLEREKHDGDVLHMVDHALNGWAEATNDMLTFASGSTVGPQNHVSWYAWAPWVKDELHGNLSESAHILGIAGNSNGSAVKAAFGAHFTSSMPLFLFPHDLVLSELWALIKHPSYWVVPWSWHQYLERAVGKIENVALGKFGLSGIRLSGLWGSAQRGWPSPVFSSPTARSGWSQRSVDGYGSSLQAPLVEAVTFIQQLYWVAQKLKDSANATEKQASTKPEKQELKAFVSNLIEDDEMFNSTVWGSMLSATCDLDAQQAAHPSGQGSSAVSTVFTLYVRLHLKRQLHYLRIGMLALFVLAGDVEDGVATLLWPLLCWLMFICPLGSRYNRRELEQPADIQEPLQSIDDHQSTSGSVAKTSSLWIASPFAFFGVVLLAACIALALTLLVSVFFPDLLAELLRVGVMFEVASVSGHALVAQATGSAGQASVQVLADGSI